MRTPPPSIVVTADGIVKAVIAVSENAYLPIVDNLLSSGSNKTSSRLKQAQKASSLICLRLFGRFMLLIFVL